MPPNRRIAVDEPESVLLVLPTWVGDFVMATPTLRAIQERFRDARITFLLNPNLRELVAGGDWMDECIEWGISTATVRERADGDDGNAETPKNRNTETITRPRDWWGLRRALRARRFDLAIVLPNSFRSAFIAWLSGAKRRIGYARDVRSFLLTDRIPVRNLRRSEHEAEAMCSPAAPGWASRVTAEGRCATHSSPLPYGRGTDKLPHDRDSGELPHGHSSDGTVRMGSKLPVRLGRYVPMPLVEYYADLAEAIGCERPGHDLELFTTSDCEASIERRLRAFGQPSERPLPPPHGLPDGGDRGRLVVMSPGAKYGAAKCWMPERFAAVADRLMETCGTRVAITCGPGEEPIARAICAAMKDRTAPSSPRSSPWEGEGVSGSLVFDDPVLSLGELKSLIRRCDLLIGNDAGPRHIAKAFGVPVVTVFGPTHPDWTSTDYEDERIVRIDVDCGPCQQRVCPLGHHQCMTGVTVDAVYEAASELLRSRSHQHVATP